MIGDCHGGRIAAFGVLALLALAVSGAADGRAAASAEQCRGSTRHAVIACCLRLTARHAEGWMINGYQTCQDAAVCAMSYRDKATRCWIQTIADPWQTNEENP